jgi:hypothetical protein
MKNNGYVFFEIQNFFYFLKAEKKFGVKYIFLILEGKYHYYHQGKEIEDEQKQSK